MFKRILIANRGEIACRIIKTARRMGIQTVAVYSEADRDALHVEMADEAVLIGPPAAAESYLAMDKIIAACRETGAEAVGGYHADSLTLWSEEFQEWYYKEQVAMLKKMPDNFTGISPWILVDFRSPRRNNPLYQEGWNKKGLIDAQGHKKKAFYILQRYYAEKRQGQL